MPRTIDEQLRKTLPAEGPPEDYSEIAQQDFLQNYFALTTTYSALHAPVPHEPGHGSVGLDAGFIPPLGCRRRLVLAYTKTEDVNKSPVFPRVRVSFAFSRMGQMVPYASFAYTPPIRVGGVSASAVSGEAGVGFQPRRHLSARRAFPCHPDADRGRDRHPFVEGDTEFDDVYWASTFGVDALVGLDLDVVTPYVAVGITDASNFFYVGDDSVVVNNFHPYLGAVFSAGAQAPGGGARQQQLRRSERAQATPRRAA